jgi:DNA-binding NarL/FixJ family response regulator
MLIDDNDGVREAIAEALVRDGHDVVGQAADGHDGVELGRRLQPDVVITDWRMPVMDGVEATRQIRAACPAITVIAFCSTDSATVEHGFLRAGAHACVDKRDIARLRDTLRELDSAGDDPA